MSFVCVGQAKGCVLSISRLHLIGVLCSICATEAHDATLMMSSDAAQIRFVRLCSAKEAVTRHAYDSRSAKQSINLANGLPLSATTAEQLHDQGSWCPQIRLYSCATHFS